MIDSFYRTHEYFVTSLPTFLMMLVYNFMLVMIIEDLVPF